ncbi:MAG: Hpt domain-containing protein [Promethearchaeota archaeon]
MRTFYLEELKNNLINLDAIIREICQDPSNQQKISECKILFHSIKGDSGIIGAKNMYRYCSLFESLLSNKEIKINNYYILLKQSLKTLKMVLDKNIKEDDFDLDKKFLIELELALDEKK